jgi:hypothetical protein
LNLSALKKGVSVFVYINRGLLNENIQMYVEKMRTVLSRPHLHELAVSSGFCRRSSKLSAEIFFDLLFYAVSRTEIGSLSFLVSHLKSSFGITISKQSLDERFHSGCVAFVKAVLSEVLKERFAGLYSGRLLPSFQRIRIKDSTKFMVPPELESHYKGGGGDSKSRSGAGVSIQYEYDLKSGEITDLNITPGNRNDREDAGAGTDSMQAGDLIIRDLGYFSTPVLESCADRKAFFLSRLESGTNVYDLNGEIICFKDIYEQMRKSGLREMETVVCVGKKTRLQVRLFLQLVPQEVYETRIREKTKKSKGQGRGELTEETKIRCKFNLFITNADESMLAREEFVPLYRLRWQVELNFKVWKSVFKIDGYRRMKENRYIALLYAKLLLIVIHLQITHCLQKTLLHEKSGKIRMLSLNKSMKTLHTLFHEIFTMLRSCRHKSMQTVRYLQEKLSEDHWLESKNKKMCFPEILYLFICKSEI